MTAATCEHCGDYVDAPDPHRTGYCSAPCRDADRARIDAARLVRLHHRAVRRAAARGRA